MRNRALLIGSSVVFLLESLSAGAQQPEIVDARMDQTSAAAGLSAAIASATHHDAAPAWIGYAVPGVAGGRSNHGWGFCSLDLEEGSNHPEGSATAPETSKRSILVFLRVKQERIEKVRMFEPACRVDADGMAVHWVTGVRPADSVELLRAFVLSEHDKNENHSVGGAVAAIASTDDTSADVALEQFTNVSAPVELRKETVFWLGAVRGTKGYEMLRTIVAADPNDGVRDKAIFALSISPVPQAVDTLIDVARHDPSAHLRGQALFWLAHKVEVKAAGAITSATEDDPDMAVKKKAVFALTQLPPDQGIPMLIKVAETNRNLEVRKQAIFWLGQSHDPRALDFIARVVLTP
jgi:hypothetical protein